MKGILIKILIIASVTAMTGCRIGAAVFEGGSVMSASGSRHCFEGRTCEYEVNDTNFTETFTAQPRTGYEFVKWRAGDGFLCANSTDPTCIVSNVGAEGNAVIEAVVASDSMFYIAPEFRCVIEYCPATLDGVLLELQEASQVVEAYVAYHGSYPYNNASFGINTSSRTTGSLIAYIKVVPYILYAGGPVYLSAAVYNSLWDGSGTPSHSALSFFSLSGTTNADDTMSWRCITGDGGGGSAIAYQHLPIECRG